ncbi:MAG: chitobiase/beta-hexosaminidase C-terminal domain-containing protein [Spirochaetia bacterium]|nr:chitobiase/beta-hexosaminidase C-terminal domain-containing protein [Spirochaetia bacterium]
MKEKNLILKYAVGLVLILITFYTGCAPATTTPTTTTTTTTSTPDTTAPTAPTGGLTAVAINTTQIDLSWGLGSDNVTSQANLTYEICKTTVSGGCNSFVATYIVPSGTTYTQTYSATGLTSLTKYYFAIRTKDEAGNVSISTNQAFATTLSTNTAQTPTFSPVQGTYNVAQTVAISSATLGATVCYTSDNTTPACTLGGCTSGSLYSSPVFLAANSTLKTVACAPGYLASAVNTANYTIDTTSPTAPTGGLTAIAISTTQISLSWGLGSDNITSQANLVYEICRSLVSGGCSVFTPVYNINAQSTYTQNAIITGLAANTTYYFSVRTKDTAGNVSIATAETSAATLANNIAATPTFSPAQGTYGVAQNIAISSATAGATICYTNNGPTPVCSATMGACTAGTAYATPVVVSANAALKAISCATGYLSSAVNTGAYTIDTVNPAAPAGLTAVAINSAQIDLSWLAATDNITPQTGLVYEICQSAITGGCTTFTPAYTTITGAQTYSITGLSALTPYYFVIRTKDSAGNASTATTQVTATTCNAVATPTFSPPQGMYNTTQLVSITSSTPGASICYTSNGATPACTVGACTTGTLYSAPIWVSAVTKIKAQACATGFLASVVNSADYTIDTTPPTIPVIFSVHRNFPNLTSANLSWNASTDNLTASANLTYQICQSMISGSCAGTFIPTYITAAGATTLSVTGLSANVKYYYVMRAVDALGNISAISNEMPLVFSDTGSMASARYWHTATLLANGKVLITGGLSGGQGPVATAEIYDPALGTFAATGSMASARYNHTATLLANGKVLITGGHNGAAVVATAEIYDPALGTFAATGSMASARYWHTATLLANGNVLITGGISAGVPGMPTPAEEIYDPALGTFAATSSMASARSYHTATLLANGNVLITGGIDTTTGSPQTTVEIFDPALGTFAATGLMASARYGHTATLLTNGKVLITGGVGGDIGANGWAVLTTAEIFQ